MSSIRLFSTVLLAAVASCYAQSGFVTVSSPSPNVLVSGQMQLAASVTNLAGTPMDASGIQWASSDGTIGAVSAAGLVKGILPGDITITASDSNTGASSTMLLHVIPGAITLQVSSSQLHAGESTQLTASALDAVGKPIPGVPFEFRSGAPAIAKVGANGALLGVAEGFTTIEVRIPTITSNAALIATTQVHVLPPLYYKLKKLISTDVTAPTTIAAFSSVNAVSASEVASIVTLANGGQAAVLIEAGKPVVLAVAGQVLPNAGRMVLRIDAISTNSKGDVALLIEYPQQFCAATVILFPHGKPEQELGAANCNGGLSARSLSEDGNVMYRYNDQVWVASASTSPQLLFSLATQPAVNDPIRTVNDFAPSRAGTFILNTNLTSGAHAYLYFDGKSLIQVYKDGDPIGGFATSGMDLPVGGPDGSFYARVNGNNLEVLAKVAPGPLKAIVTNGDDVAGGNVTWIDSVADISASGVLMVGAFNTNSSGHRSLAVFNGKGVVEYALADGYGAMVSGTMLSNGSVVASASLVEFSIPGLRAIAGNGTQTMLLAAGTPFPQPAPAGVDWHIASRGGNASAIPYRGIGDAILNVGSSPQTLLTLGATLPNKQTAITIGPAIANESGDIAFTASYPTGSALFRYRGGKFETLIDANIAGEGPGGVSLSYVRNDRSRHLAMNNRGDVVAWGVYNPDNATNLVLFSSDGPHLVAQLNKPAPGGGNFTNFQTSLAIDDSGRVMFSANTSDGKVAAYYWDGRNLQRVVGIGDNGPPGLTVTGIANLAGSGSGFLIMVNSSPVVELRYFDGLQIRTIESTDTSLLDGTGLSSFWASECTLSANGDAHCMAATQDGGYGVYAHRTDGRDLIVARTRDQFPGGEWMIMPLSVSSSLTGEVYFTAHVWLNGVEALALYQAAPQ